MSQIDVNVIAPLGYTGPNLPGNNNFVQIIDSAGNIIFKVFPSDSNIAIGRSTLTNTTGQYNTAVGAYALSLNTTGTENTALGLGAGSGASTATKSVFVGANSGGYTQSGNENTVIGFEAGYGQNPFGPNTGMGDGNTCIGSKSGHQLTGGTYNTFIGFEAGYPNTTGTNNTCIGRGSTSGSLTVSNTFTLGDSAITVLRCAVQTIIGLSDERDKTNVQESAYGLDLVKSLKPVTFEWDTRDGAKKGDKDLGFIAQDLQSVDDEYLGLVYAENPERLEASYGRLIPVLVKAIQELTAKVEALENK